MVEREITRHLRVQSTETQPTVRPYITVYASGQDTELAIRNVKAEVAPSVGDTVEVVFRWSTEATETERRRRG